MDQNQDRQRGHSYRPRRGSDRRGPSRRPNTQHAQDRPGRDRVDVEQIMRDIRGRIAQRQGINLSNQQIHELAARRLESILDPRTIEPSLLDGLKRSAAAPIGSAEEIPNEPTFLFDDTTLYDSHRGALRLARRLLNPLLKLFFNPNPLIRALHLQAKLNVEAARRDAQRERRQTEWNALHYEIVQRLVTEVSRVSLELQALSMRVDALGARVDFNDRRVSGLESPTHRARSQGRPSETVLASTGGEAESAQVNTLVASGDAQTPDVARRRRRRRRGRRSGSTPGESGPSAAQGVAATASSGGATVEAPPAVDEARTEANSTVAAPANQPPAQLEVVEPSPAAPPAPVEPAGPTLPFSPLDTDRHED